jgi:predicted lipid-binding transport protein (Tim44 family)
MNEAFDLTNLIFLALAVFILLRLRSVLGRRTGNERKPFDPYSAPDTGNNAPRSDPEDTVVKMPGRTDRPNAGEDEDKAPDWGDFAPKGSPLAKAFDSIRRLDHSFEPAGFLDGAKIAYEMIVMAFADSDRKTLKSLLSRDVYDSFIAVLDGRESRSEVVESNFVGIERADILEAGLKAKQASVTVKFVSELTSATRNAQGEVIEGDPKKTREVVDIWTFTRDAASRDPNWKLVATEAAN